MIVFMGGGIYLTSDFVDSSFNKVLNAAKPGYTGKIYHTQFDDYPRPAAAYLKQAVKDGAERTSFVRLKQEAQFKTGSKSEFFPLYAEQYYALNEPSFLWDAVLKPGMFSIRAIDSYINGQGNMLVKVFSSMTIADEVGEELDLSTFQRFCMEGIFYPSFLADTNFVKWSPADSSSAKALFTHGDNSFEAVYYFGENNLVERVHIPGGRWKTTPAGYVNIPYTVTCSSYKTFGDFMIPTYAEVTWNEPTEDFTYGKFSIKQIEYNLPEKYEDE